MATHTREDVLSWRGRDLVDNDGDKIGSIEDIYLDRQSGEPEWIAVKTGLLGARVSFVPIRDARLEGDDVRVACSKDTVKDAPNVDADGELSPEEERALYRHYGRSDYDEWTDTSEDRALRTGDTNVDRDAADTVGRDDDVSGRGTDDAMTRSEEELRVGTQSREVGRARLRKHVVTEEESKTVPLEREEPRVGREPIGDDNIDQAMSGPDITESEHDVTLYEDEPVVEKRVEPKERIRLEKVVQTEERTVSGEVRKERVEAEGDITGDR
jgi:stress response protein YsnF